MNDSGENESVYLGTINVKINNYIIDTKIIRINIFLNRFIFLHITYNYSNYKN